MGLNGVQFVAVLTWTLLLLGLVQGWIEITNSQDLMNILAGRSFDAVKPDAYAKPAKFDKEEGDEDEFYDNGEDDDDEDGDFDSELYEPETPASPKPGPDKEDPTGFSFSCTTNAIYISIKEVDGVKVIGSKDLLSVEEAAKSCGYNLNREKGTLMVPFTGCFVKKEQMDFSVQLLLAGGSQVRTATCPGPDKSGPSPRAGQTSLNCPFTTAEIPIEPRMDPLKEIQILVPFTTTPNCAFSTERRVPCGFPWMSKDACENMGCCWHLTSCFYPMDECTKDHNFVFSINHDTASLPLDPSSLVIPGTSCQPIILTDTFAVFKFHMSECGTKAFTVGETQIYLAEVQTTVETQNLKYGVISRSTQLRFLIECRYSSSDTNILASTGYMVITPTVPSAVYATGLYGVELTMATDETYSSFYPTYHRPLRLLLGKPIYLQLHLVSPVPEAVILVNYCVAYPRSASNALVLVHEGCANPYDQDTYVLLNSGFGEDGRVRRFMVKAFQFMEQNTNKYLDEEIYFMCSTEVCLPIEKTCSDQCFA